MCLMVVLRAICVVNQRMRQSLLNWWNIGCIEQALVKQEHTLLKQEQAVVNKLEKLRVQLDSSSSSMALMSDVDKGIGVSKSTVRLIMPKPLSDEEAEGLWPEACWTNPEGAESRVLQRASEWTDR